jgi:hypothetical protein
MRARGYFIICTVLLLAVTGLWIGWKAAGAPEQPQGGGDAGVVVRLVALEAKNRELQEEVESLYKIVLMGSAMTERRLSRVELDRRPEIKIDKATVFNAYGEIVVEDHK